MTRQDIMLGVQNLGIMHRSNPTVSGLRIVINALNDYADEAKKINENDLSNYLRNQAAKLNAAQQSVQPTVLCTCFKNNLGTIERPAQNCPVHNPHSG